MGQCASNTSSVIGTASYGRSSCNVCALWAFAIGRSPPDHPGKTLTLKDSSARSAGSAWTTHVFGETHLRRIVGYAAYIISRGPIDLWTRTPRSIAPFSASAPSHHNLSSADFIINIAELNFRYTQAWICVVGYALLAPLRRTFSKGALVLAGFNPLWLDLNLAGAGFDLSLTCPLFRLTRIRLLAAKVLEAKEPQNRGALPERRELWLCSKGPTEKET